MPRMLSVMALDAGRNHTYDLQVINGAPLRWNWDHHADGPANGGSDSWVELSTGHYDTVIMTEALPLDNHIQWSSPEIYGGNFFNLAVRSNSNAQVYMYETWHGIDDPTWRARLVNDLPKWERIVDQINAANPVGRRMLLVPAGQAMGLLVDRMESGRVPGLTSRTQVFQSDGIHPNDIGNYFVACVQYATIYRRSPVGLMNRTTNPWGGPYQTPSPETARALQEIAWEVVSTYPRSRVSVLGQ
ncbi:MAG: hypothetical protein AB1540_10255 [Bdellovibrionota bacterium]